MSGSRSTVAAESTWWRYRPAAAAAVDSDRSRGMTAFGSLAPIAGPAPSGVLRRISVLDTTDFGGRRAALRANGVVAVPHCAAARRRVLVRVAGAIADGVARRVTEAPDGRPTHDLMGRGECHARFLADAVLLLLAEGRNREAARGLAGLTGMSTPWRGGALVPPRQRRERRRSQRPRPEHPHPHRGGGAGVGRRRGSTAGRAGHGPGPAERARAGSGLAAMLAASDRMRARGGATRLRTGPNRWRHGRGRGRRTCGCREGGWPATRPSARRRATSR